MADDLTLLIWINRSLPPFTSAQKQPSLTLISLQGRSCAAYSVKSPVTSATWVTSPRWPTRPWWTSSSGTDATRRSDRCPGSRKEEFSNTRQQKHFGLPQCRRTRSRAGHGWRSSAGSSVPQTDGSARCLHVANDPLTTLNSLLFLIQCQHNARFFWEPAPCPVLDAAPPLVAHSHSTNNASTRLAVCLLTWFNFFVSVICFHMFGFLFVRGQIH